MAQKKKSFVPKKKIENGVEFVKNIFLEGNCLLMNTYDEYAVLERDILKKSGDHDYPQWADIYTKLPQLDRKTVDIARIELDSDGYIVRTKHGMYSITNSYTLYYLEGDFE